MSALILILLIGHWERYSWLWIFLSCSCYDTFKWLISLPIFGSFHFFNSKEQSQKGHLKHSAQSCRYVRWYHPDFLTSRWVLVQRLANTNWKLKTVYADSALLLPIFAIHQVSLFAFVVVLISYLIFFVVISPHHTSRGVQGAQLILVEAKVMVCAINHQ